MKASERAYFPRANGPNLILLRVIVGYPLSNRYDANLVAFVKGV